MLPNTDIAEKDWITKILAQAPQRVVTRHQRCRGNGKMYNYAGRDREALA